MKTKMRLFSGILAIMMLFFAVTDSAIVANAANTAIVKTASGNDVSGNTVSANVVVKQKVDVTSLFSKSHDKYAIAKADKKAAKVTKKGVLTAKKPGVVTVEAFDKEGKKISKKASETIKVTIVEVQTKAQKKATFTNKKAIVLNDLMSTKVDGSKFEWSQKDLDKLAKKAVVTVSDNTVSGNSVSGNAVSGNGVSGNYVDGKALVINKAGKISLTGIYTNKLAQDKYDAAIKAAAGNKKAEKKALKELTKSQAKYKVSISIKLPKVSKSKVTLKAGKTKTVKAKLPKGVSATATWYSKNPAVATIDNSGVITAVAAGETDIVMVVEGYEYTAHVKVK